MNQTHAIRWIAKSNYVDVDTGEEITKNKMKQDYIKIKTKKHASIKNTTGTIEYTIECRKNPQGNLFTTD